MISQYVKATYFDVPSAMMLSDRGNNRLATMKYNAKNEGLSQKGLNKKISQVFTLSTEDFKFFAAVNNCNKP